MEEEWRSIPGYASHYEASSLGHIRSLPRRDARGRTLRSRLLKPTGQYAMVNVLRLDGAQQPVRAGVLVLLAFVGCPEKGHVCRHLNDNPYDNTLENLRWGTKKENAEDASRNGLLKWPRFRRTRLQDERPDNQ